MFIITQGYGGSLVATQGYGPSQAPPTENPPGVRDPGNWTPYTPGLNRTIERGRPIKGKVVIEIHSGVSSGDGTVTDRPALSAPAPSANVVGVVTYFVNDAEDFQILLMLGFFD